MPHYYFYIQDGSDVQDCDGVELASVEAARSYGLTLAGELIRDAGIHGNKREDWGILVTDQIGLILFRMIFCVSKSAITASYGAARSVSYPTAS